MGFAFFFLVTPPVRKMAPVGSGNMAMPQSITVVRAGLSGAFNKTVPRIPSSGTCNHQGMHYQPRVPGRRCGLGGGGCTLPASGIPRRVSATVFSWSPHSPGCVMSMTAKDRASEPPHPGGGGGTKQFSIIDCTRAWQYPTPGFCLGAGGAQAQEHSMCCCCLTTEQWDALSRQQRFV